MKKLYAGHNAIGTEHLLLGILREGEGSAATILKALSVDLNALRKVVESAIQNNEKSDYTNSDHIELKKQAARAIKLTYLELKVFKSTEVRTAHLLLSMLKDENSVVTRALFQFNVDYDAVKNEFSMMLSDINPKDEDSPAPKTEFGYSDHENEDDELFENKPKKSSTPANMKQVRQF